MKIVPGSYWNHAQLPTAYYNFHISGTLKFKTNPHPNSPCRGLGVLTHLVFRRTHQLDGYRLNIIFLAAAVSIGIYNIKISERRS